MIDTHCHIDMYPDPNYVLGQCESKDIIAISMTNLPSHFIVGRKYFLNKKHSRIALGLHPLSYDKFQIEFPSFLNSIDQTSYIGEIGLDFSREATVNKKDQLEYFNQIIAAVSNQNKILSIHSRRAEKEVLEVLQSHKIKHAIFHWYSGPISMLDKIIAEGYSFSINYSMINSLNGEKIIDAIPRNLLLTESDGPYTKIKNQICYPWDVKYTYEYLSKKWNIAIEDVAKIVKKNFFDMINIIK
jgi:TatD DNase family protein